MKKIVIACVALTLIGVGTYAALRMQQTREAANTSGAYAYRCKDGTEFSMQPSEGMDSITIIPATSVEHIERTVLRMSEATSSGALYIGGGIVFSGTGETVTLSFHSTTTTCSPVNRPDEAPFNFGDPVQS